MQHDELDMGATLSLVMPYYMNPGMLERHYQEWALWSPAFIARTEFIIVDDGSPQPAIMVPRPDWLTSLSIYRVLEDRPWHQHGARNLGAHQARGQWLLLTDMDHILTADAARKLFELLPELDTDCIYMMHRVEADTGLPTAQYGVTKPHPNSFVVTRDTFWRIGGYDEDYCGIYGTDRMFRERAFQVARPGFLGDVSLTRYWRDIIPDASTTTLPRKEGRDPGAKARVMRWKAKRGETGSIKVLQFPWERVL